MTAAMSLPGSHPQRLDLNDEVHARPTEQVPAPASIVYLALLSDLANREREAAHVAELAAGFGVPGPAAGANHYAARLGAIQVKWERHTEFTRYTFVTTPDSSDPAFASSPIDRLPRTWVSELPGQLIVAVHAAIRAESEGAADYEAISHRDFAGNSLVGSGIAGGLGIALTDFRIGSSGYSRFLVLNRGMTHSQTGRMVQRLLEMETYRILALLAFPVARELGPVLTRCGDELAKITSAMTQGRGTDEAALLDRLTRLEAQIEERASVNHYRFGAATAYYRLVRSRIGELREERIQGLQTFQEFTERRLAPAMDTCSAVANRQESLSRRVARATHLLSTRVGIMQERQNQALLESMNRRARLQLRLQETVEGLSVAAITYYVASLLGVCAKGMKALGMPVDPDVVMLLSIPLVALAAATGVLKVRRMVTSGGQPS